MGFVKELVARGAMPDLTDSNNLTAAEIMQRSGQAAHVIKGFKNALNKTANAGGKKKGRNRKK